MTHNDLLEAVNSPTFMNSRTLETPYIALRAVLELCKEAQNDIDVSGFAEGIVQAIEKELL